MQLLTFNVWLTTLRRQTVVIAMTVVAAIPAAAQESSTDQPQRTQHRKADIMRFLAGAAVGLAAHEGGHLVFDLAFDARPRITRVALGGIPFFALTHRDDLSPRREFAVSSA